MENIDLRNEFDQLLKEYGHYVILQRSSRKIRCTWINPQTGKPCWDERAQEAYSKCPVCLGTGWIVRAERHLARKENASQVVSQPGLRRQEEPGVIWTPASQFFFYHDAHPQVGDIIYEVGWRGNRPINLYTVHLIQHTEPIRGDHGRIEFWTAFTRTLTVDKEFRERILRTRFGVIPDYKLLGGEAP